MCSKIDAKGNYLFHPGITIVCHLSTTERRLWKAVRQFIIASPLLSKYYSPLPESSYHMTLYDVYSVSKAGSLTRFFRTVSKGLDMCRDIKDVLDQVSFAPKAKIIRTYARGTLGIQLNLGVLEPIALSIRHSIRDILEHEAQSYLSHMSLAYLVRPIEKKDGSALQAEIEELNRVIVSVSPTLELNFLKATLCTFDDMKAFVGWTTFDTHPWTITDSTPPTRASFLKDLDTSVDNGSDAST